ncbi:MAG: tRNA (guanosine(46)-N7)-methyltransferase TrmB [Alphaproteobacteria bacterium]|nr:tRNA (guanosine(46)-N7)-methyltransferase TrmB [Alphaproteobacteria bacterium]
MAAQHRLYGRSAGKPLSERRQRLLAEKFPEVSVPDTSGDELDPLRLFPSAKEVWLEIGFGGGEHLAGQARRHPDVGLVGVEPFLDGIAKILGLIEEERLENIRLRRGDARDLVAQLAPASLDRVFILFPDPWPKTRHHKRRLVRPDFLDSLARTLKDGARVRFATDWADYANSALEAFLADHRFSWVASCADDWRMPPSDHVPTRYQAKGLGDCRPVFFDFHFTPLLIQRGN